MESAVPSFVDELVEVLVAVEACDNAFFFGLAMMIEDESARNYFSYKYFPNNLTNMGKY